MEHLAVNNSSIKSEVEFQVWNCDSCMSGVSMKSCNALTKWRSSLDILIYEALDIRHPNPTLSQKLCNQGSPFSSKVFKFYLFDYLLIIIHLIWLS